MQPLLFPRHLLKLLYWIFFKPITLDRYIHQIDPTLDRDAPIYTLWKHSKEHPEFRSLLALLFFHLLITTWLVTFFIVGLFATAGFEIDWPGLVAGVAIGLVIGLLLSAFTGVGAVGFGVAVGGGFGAGLGLLVGEGFDMVSSVAMGMGLGAALSTGYAMAATVWFGVAFSILAGGIFGMAGGVGFGVVAGVSCLVAYFRLILYIFESPWSWLLSRSSAGKKLSFSPIAWDELIWFRLPGLDKYLLSIARQDRKRGLEAINYVAASFRQGWAARNAVLALMVDDVESANDLQSIANISGTLGWLPQGTRDELKSILLGLDEISRHARAALESETPYNRQEQLRIGLNLIERIRRGVATDTSWQPGGRLISALDVWEKTFSHAYALAQEEKGIQNVYVAGSPLQKESKIFKGRRDVFRALERELVSQADQRPALLLFGARRMGKTSVLTQLPNAIGPQVIPVMVDLQKAALSDNAASLFVKIAESIQNSALINRSITLPDVSKNALESEPYRAMSDWLEKVDKSVGERWILLCLDEYEYLEKMLRDKRIDERAFQLLRTLIQNHPRLTLLFSGAHTLEDLQPLWSNYLINVRIVKINPLTEEDAEELITRPVPDFKMVYDQDALDRVLSETGHHPYLIQATCQDLVHRLNDDNRFTAHLEDVEQALDSALESGAAYFNDLWAGPDSNEIQRAIQMEVAKAKTGKLSLSRLETALSRSDYAKQDIQAGLGYLIHRDMLKQDNTYLQFRFELVRRWIRYQKLGLRQNPKNR